MKTAAASKTTRPRSRGEPGVVDVDKTVFTSDGHLRIPGWVVDIESFRRWTDTKEFPERGYIWWLAGEVFADMSKEQIFTHVDVKGTIYAVLYFLARDAKLGRVFTDGVLFTNYDADISGNPDGLFFSNETLTSDRIRFVEGAEKGIVEVQGRPDMVLVVVSDSSVKKDLVTLQQAYWKAGIAEYWLVDARQDPLRFDVMRHTVKGFKPSPKKHGWIASSVFGKSFRLSATKGEFGYPEYTLEVR
jgi:Uma2 family endonuclease